MTARFTVFAGPANERLGAETCELLSISPAADHYQRFPDGEIAVGLRQPVRADDVVIIQSTSPPVETHLIQLLLLADACRRAGAGRLTAVIPYLGYARQDQRSERGSLGARVMTDALATARFDRVMLIDAHTPAIEGFFDVPLDHLSAVPALAHALAARPVREDAVIVAPDYGAVKRARAYARALQRPMAVVHKTRLTGTTVEALGVIGHVRNRAPIIVDDMISTGGTIAAAVVALRAAGAIDPITVVATHALLVGDALDTLSGLALDRVLVANTLPVVVPADPRVEVVSVAPLIATALQRSRGGDSLADLQLTA